MLASAIAAFERLHVAERRQQVLACSGPASRALLWLLLFLRAVPSALLSAGMLPHQACAWFEGILSHTAEFETTPKSGAVGVVSGAPPHPGGSSGSSTSPLPRAKARTQRCYVLMEVAFVLLVLLSNHVCYEYHCRLLSCHVSTTVVC